MTALILAAGDSNSALIGVMATLVTALVGSLGFLIKAMSDRIDKKDLELREARIEITRALTESSALLQRVIDRLDADARAQEAARAPARRRAATT